MQIKDLSKKVTSKVLNESLAKNFGYKLKLESFNNGQLEDVRNKLRTEISQFELSESYDSLINDGKYQKTKALLDVINEEILEREAFANQPTTTDIQVSEHAMHTAIRHRAGNFSVPESWINNAIKRMQLGESDRDELSAELSLRYDLNEAQASWVLLEGEEEKAENILSTKDMVSKITNWIEDTAAMKADQLIELIDSISKFQDSTTADQFKGVVSSALEGLYSALVTCREGLSQGLGIVSGEQVETMGGTSEPPIDATAIPAELGPEELPELGANVGTEAGGATEAGRLKRESAEYSRKLGLMLSEQKKK